MKKLFLFFFSCILLSCNSELELTGGNAFSFSKDTLTFDTVFSGIGSSTSKFLVYNKTKDYLTFKSIFLSSGKESFFRINVDGSVSENHSFTNIELAPGDSMFVFVEVNIDASNSNNPVVISDSIVFNLQNSQKSVKLEAFGKDMILLKNHTFLSDTVLNPDKPYLIYGNLTVDSARILTITAGCELYFHQNSGLVVKGTLRVNGNLKKPVLMQGDRFDAVRFSDPVPYQKISGQWNGVYLLNPGAQHVLNYLNLRSAYVGLYSPNNDWTKKTNIRITNSKIHNHTFYGLVAVNTDVQVYNSEISNTGSYTVYLNGGKHTFIHTTIANYFNRKSGVQPIQRENHPAVMVMDLNKAADMNTIFRNCVISGYNASELSLASKYADKLNAVFENCYIVRATPYEFDFFKNDKWSSSKDTVFKSTQYDYETGEYFDFTPDSASVLQGLANPTYSKLLPLDLNGKSRMTDGSPDAGAYEWFPMGN